MFEYDEHSHLLDEPVTLLLADAGRRNALLGVWVRDLTTDS